MSSITIYLDDFDENGEYVDVKIIESNEITSSRVKGASSISKKVFTLKSRNGDQAIIECNGKETTLTIIDGRYVKHPVWIGMGNSS